MLTDAPLLTADYVVTARRGLCGRLVVVDSGNAKESLEIVPPDKILTLQLGFTDLRSEALTQQGLLFAVIHTCSPQAGLRAVISPLHSSPSCTIEMISLTRRWA
jgi:hypothetical protein